MTRNLNYSQGHSLINHCDRRITHLSDTDISFILLYTHDRLRLMSSLLIDRPR